MYNDMCNLLAGIQGFLQVSLNGLHSTLLQPAIASEMWSMRQHYCDLFTTFQALPLTELDHCITHFNMFHTCELIASSYVSIKWEPIVNNVLLDVSLQAWLLTMMCYQKLLANLFIQFTVCSNHFYLGKLQMSVGWKKHYMQLN